MSNCYGTEIEIWAVFGPVGSTEKKLGKNKQLLRVFFHVRGVMAKSQKNS